MGERGVRNAEVEGSIPFSSTSTTSSCSPGIAGQAGTELTESVPVPM